MICIAIWRGKSYLLVREIGTEVDEHILIVWSLRLEDSSEYILSLSDLEETYVAPFAEAKGPVWETDLSILDAAIWGCSHSWAYDSS